MFAESIEQTPKQSNHAIVFSNEEGYSDENGDYGSEYYGEEESEEEDNSECLSSISFSIPDFHIQEELLGSEESSEILNADERNPRETKSQKKEIKDDQEKQIEDFMDDMCKFVHVDKSEPMILCPKLKHCCYNMKPSYYDAIIHIEDPKLEMFKF